eukprot:CAMPEP_0119284848 /NCGR_PEP_ID=MMETSP1329-20130426/31071_1 /TAXON_ID=114041 /ORGANISM="Genus nov. species nov., Strain RCC1024" /LENGTH=45 /DNA_ID= /DNA_START= /DNA_END= /DNA_ORIENTATION=
MPAPQNPLAAKASQRRRTITEAAQRRRTMSEPETPRSPLERSNTL